MRRRRRPAHHVRVAHDRRAALVLGVEERVAKQFQQVAVPRLRPAAVRAEPAPLVDEAELHEQPAEARALRVRARRAAQRVVGRVQPDGVVQDARGGERARVGERSAAGRELRGERAELGRVALGQLGERARQRLLRRGGRRRARERDEQAAERGEVVRLARGCRAAVRAGQVGDARATQQERARGREQQARGLERARGEACEGEEEGRPCV